MPSPATPITLHDVDKLAAHVANFHEPPTWLSGWAASLLAGQNTGLAHLAVMAGPYLDRLLDGTKTIESRFSRHRVAPFGQVNDGDVIFFKPSAGPITAVGLAGTVHHLDLGIVPLQQVAAQYGREIAPADASFWNDRAGARFATLVTMTHIVKTKPLPISKRDRRGWVVLSQSLPAADQVLF